MRTHNLPAALYAICAMCVAGHSARAADCQPLALVNSVTLEPMENDDRFTVPVQINGQAEHLIVDSGTPLTMLGPETAKKLGLRLLGTRTMSLDVEGHTSTTQAIANTFDLGSAHAENFHFDIYPGEMRESGPGGLISPRMFSRSDIDFDFGARRFNVFSQDHCEGRVVYWLERPLAVIPMDTKSGHINLPVTVDGHAMTAIIDTGATETMMTATAAKFIMNLEPGSDDAPQIGQSKTDPLLKYYSHQFASLGFGGVNVLNPKIIIMTDRTGSQVHPDGSTGSRIHADTVHLNDLTIGMNVLTQLHLYVAYGENKLYITPAGTESALPKPAQPSGGPSN